MSANGDDGDGDDGPGRREVAYRLFAAEFEDADLEYSESDEERAPNYVVTPTGGRVNRLFAVGVLTEVESVSDDVLRGRLVDPTGAFVMYAGQYQQDERAFLDRADPPAFVAVTGKARTFQPEDSDRVFTSVRPESLSEVDADTRDRWTVDAAEQTIDRVRAVATAIALDAEGDRLEAALVERGVEPGLADGIVQALAHYETTPTYLAAVRDLAVDAARHVAGELDEVPGLEASPDATGDVVASDLLAEPVEPLGEPSNEDAAGARSGGQEPDPEPESGTATADAAPKDETAAAAGAAAQTEEPASSEDGETVATDAAETTETTETTEATEATETSDETATDTEEGPGDFEPEEFDLDEEEREEIEAEYGTEFQSGTEVEEPGEADIQTPDPEDVAESDATESSGASDAAAAETAEEPAGDGPSAAESDTGAPAETAGDVDLVDAAVDTMAELDDGDGADRAAVVETVADRHGADPADVEDAIQDALMDGRCYEPDDGVLKPI